MPKRIDLTDIIKKNPRVDPKQLRESMELLEELRNRGVSERGYQLVPPFSGKRVHVVDSSSEDPRTVHLNRR
jgi:hypothetical protein